MTFKRRFKRSKREALHILRRPPSLPSTKLRLTLRQETHIKDKCGKRSLRSSHVSKKGPVAPSAASKIVAAEVKDILNLSGGDVNVLPIDKILVQVTDTSESSLSPMAFLVEPPKHSRGRRCRVGRGASGEDRANDAARL
jgi:hypothetical protein